MKVLDLPDEQDNPIRQILLKQDDDTLEVLVKKSKQEIQGFLIQAKEISTNNTIREEFQKQTSNQQEKTLEDIKNEQKLSKIKQAFPKSILDKNPDIADKFKLVDSAEDPAEKDKILQDILQTLKNP